MKFDQLPNFRIEDFRDQASWIGKLFIQLNPFVQQINRMFASGIDFANNIESITSTFTVDSLTNNSMAWSFKDQNPQSVQCLSAYKGTQNTPTTLLFSWSYDASNRVVNLTNFVEVVGTSLVAPSGKYQYTIRVTV